MIRSLNIWDDSKTYQLRLSHSSADISIFLCDRNGDSLSCPNVLMFYRRDESDSYYCAVPGYINDVLFSHFNIPTMGVGCIKPSTEYLFDRVNIVSDNLVDHLAVIGEGELIVVRYRGSIIAALSKQGLIINCGVIIDGGHFRVEWDGLPENDMCWNGYGVGVLGVRDYIGDVPILN